MENNEKEKNVDKKASPSRTASSNEERIISLLEEINNKIPSPEEYVEEEEVEGKKDGKKGSGMFWAILCPILFLLFFMVRMIFLLLD
ncbi:MAG: hypothetical protein ACI4S4_06070 [Candidatus Ornithospirochaeta sp.]